MLRIENHNPLIYSAKSLIWLIAVPFLLAFRREVKNKVMVEKALYLESEGIFSHLDSIYSSFEILNKIPNLISFAVKWDNNIGSLCKSFDAKHM